MQRTWDSSIGTNTGSWKIYHRNPARAFRCTTGQTFARGGLSNLDIGPASSVSLIFNIMCWYFRAIHDVSPTPLADLSSEARSSGLGLLVKPSPNVTTVAFIAGPKIYVRELHLPHPVVEAWLRTYSSKIAKAAHKSMKQYPPRYKGRIMHLSLTEFVTGCWKTIFIRSDENPTPIALAWRSERADDPGAWSVIDLPNAKSVISGGLGSSNVRSV